MNTHFIRQCEEMNENLDKGASKKGEEISRKVSQCTAQGILGLLFVILSVNGLVAYRGNDFDEQIRAILALLIVYFIQKGAATFRKSVGYISSLIKRSRELKKKVDVK